MNKRYWIVNDCLYALRATALPYPRQFELEVKLLKLRVELLKHETTLAGVQDCTPFQDLKQLVQDFTAEYQCEDAYREIVRRVDTMLIQTQVQAAEHALIAGTTPFLEEVSPSLQQPRARRP